VETLIWIDPAGRKISLAPGTTLAEYVASIVGGIVETAEQRALLRGWVSIREAADVADVVMYTPTLSDAAINAITRWVNSLPLSVRLTRHEHQEIPWSPLS
jgi:hypothetical protein